jgi:hypothetical protein
MKHTREFSPGSENCASHHGTYVYKLVGNDNLLKNGDLWTASVTPWQRLNVGGETTNIAVYRHPENSSDGNQYLATNCGDRVESCKGNPGQAIYQDVVVPPSYAGRSFSFWGKFRADTNATAGTLQLRVEQFDAAGRLLESNPHVTVTLPALPADSASDYSAYTPAGASGTIIPNTTRLRYVFYLQSPITYRADEMYLRVLSTSPGLIHRSGFLRQNLPSVMLSGRTCPVSVTMRNDSLVTWTRQEGYRLGIENDGQNGNWGISRVELPEDVLPGGEVTFNFHVTAPEPGVHHMHWRMVMDGVEWFGNSTADVAVDVLVGISIADAVVTEGHSGTRPTIFTLSLSGPRRRAKYPSRWGC